MSSWHSRYFINPFNYSFSSKPYFNNLNNNNNNNQKDGDWGTGNRDIVYTYARQNGIKIDSILCPTGSTQFLSQAEYIKNNNYNIIIVMLNQREAYTFLDSAKYVMERE